MSLQNLAKSVHLSELTNGIGNFTSDLYQQYIQTSDHNVLFSPISILNTLALLSQAAYGDTYTEMKNSLYLNDNKTITANQFYEYNRLRWNSKINTDLLMANQIYVNDKVSLKKEFKKLSLKKFSCGVKSMNFNNKKKTVQTINHFIEDKTHGKIKNIIQPESINSDTVAMIINAIYFKSNWKIKFNKNLTTEGDFYINDNETVRVDFMKILSNFGHMQIFELKADALEMKYANSNYSFIIILPWSRTGLSALETKLKTVDVAEIFEMISFSGVLGVDVMIPKFRAEQEIELNDILKRLGMIEMFDRNKANFHGISGKVQQFYVDSVIHKTVIDVTEDGLEEAATSLIRFYLRSSPPIILPIGKFHADHPFVYYIWDTEMKTAIFTGRITKFN